MDNTMELKDDNGSFGLPSAIPEHMADTSVGISNTAAPPATGAPDPRHTAIPLKLPAVASTSSTATNTVHSKAFIRRIMVDVKNLGRLSHEGVMGAGLARETDGVVKATCRAIVFSVVFEYSILLIILLNMISMMVKGPDPPGQPSSFASSLAEKSDIDALDMVDLTVTVVFTVEAMLKVWLQGFSDYLSDNYSRFDFVSVTLSWLSVVLDTLAPSTTSGLNLSAIRALRAVRPLRALRFFPNFRFIVEAAYRSFLSVGSSSIMLGFFILLYSIIGLQFFMGKMGSSCTFKDPSAPHPLNTIYCSSDTDCHRFSKELACTVSAAQLRGNGNWDPRFMNFDNIGYAGLVMLRVITWDNWYYLVYELSARNVPWTTLFFVIQILTVCFLSLNMFTAVVVNVFMTYRAEHVSVISKEVEQMERFDAPSGANLGLTSGFVKDALSAAMTKMPLSPRQRQVVNDLSSSIRLRWFRLQRWYRNQVMEHSLYTGFMVTLLLVNVISLCMYYDTGHGMPQQRKETLDAIQKYCIWIGNVELVVRFLSHQSLHAAYEGIGLLDPLINILSIIGIYAEDEFPNISIFRLFKFLRSAFIFEILFYFENIRRLYIAVSKTIEMLLPLFFIMMIFTCVYGLMGMQIFGFTFVGDDGRSPRLNFDSFRNSFFTLFQVITLDDWVSIICDGLQSSTLTSRILIIPYLLIFVISQCYVLLNLFIAVVVEKFELTNDNKEREQRLCKRFSQSSNLALLSRAITVLRVGSYLKRLWPWSRKSIVPLDFAVNKSADEHNAQNGHSGLEVPALPHALKDVADPSKSVGGFARISFAVVAAQKFLDKAESTQTRRALDLCCCVPARNWMRSLALCLVQHSFFDHFVLAMVMFSSVMMAIESPDVTDSGTLKLFERFNYFFLSFFASEVAIKVLAFGVPMYACEWWNLFDLAVVVLMVADLTVDNNLGYVRVFRTTRVLRAMKIMNKVSEIKHFIASLFDSWPELLSISLGFTVFIFLWGVIGISMFAGKTRFCSGNNSASHALCFGSSMHATSEFLVPNSWILGGGVDSQNQWSGSFDDIQSSVMALFEVSTLNNWGIIRATGVDATAALQPPGFNNNPWSSLYFIVFIFIAVFYLLNIVICTLVNTYRKKTGSAYRTEEQRLWHDMMRLSFALKPKMLPIAPKYQLGRLAFDIIHSTRFEVVSLAFIVLSAVTLCMEFSSQPDLYTAIIGYIHIAVTIELVLELALRYLADPSVQFFSDPWNIFDLTIVALSAALGLVSLYIDSLGLGIVQALRVVRMVRVVRVIRVNKMLQMTIMTISMSYVYLATAMLILLICVFIFAVLAFSLFGRVKYGRSLNPDNTNFDNFSNAVFSLLVMSTSYEHSYVSELSVQYPYCTSDIQAQSLGLGKVGDCGDVIAANVIFPLFFFISAHFALSILSAVIVENFAICSMLHCVIFSRIGWNDFEKFRTVWMMFDPHCKGRLTIDLIDNFVVMLGRLGSELGNVSPSALIIQCLKLYASRMATLHIKDSDLSWDSFFRTHEMGTFSGMCEGRGGVKDFNSLVKQSNEAEKHVTFRGMLFCLALFKAEEACLTYSESLVKHRFVEFVRRKASVQLLEQWALKNLRRKALQKKFGDKLIQLVQLHRFAKIPLAVAKAQQLRNQSSIEAAGPLVSPSATQRRASFLERASPSKEFPSSSSAAAAASSSPPRASYADSSMSLDSVEGFADEMKSPSQIVQS